MPQPVHEQPHGQHHTPCALPCEERQLMVYVRSCKSWTPSSHALIPHTDDTPASSMPGNSQDARPPPKKVQLSQVTHGTIFSTTISCGLHPHMLNDSECGKHVLVGLTHLHLPRRFVKPIIEKRVCAQIHATSIINSKWKPQPGEIR